LIPCFPSCTFIPLVVKAVKAFRHFSRALPSQDTKYHEGFDSVFSFVYLRVLSGKGLSYGFFLSSSITL
jgi:hypothetical protein